MTDADQFSGQLRQEKQTKQWLDQVGSKPTVPPASKFGTYLPDDSIGRHGLLDTLMASEAARKQANLEMATGIVLALAAVALLIRFRRSIWLGLLSCYVAGLERSVRRGAAAVTRDLDRARAKHGD